MKTFYNHFKFSSIAYVFVVALFAFLGCSNVQIKTEIYVSTNGDDKANGSIFNPLETIPAAVEKVRDLRKSGNTNNTNARSSD